MNIWIIILLIGVATLATRLSFIALIGGRTVPEWLRRALRFVPASVLAAIVVPELLYRGGIFRPFTPHLAAGLVAMLVSWRTRNAILTITAGLGTLWLVSLVFPS